MPIEAYSRKYPYDKIEDEPTKPYFLIHYENDTVYAKNAHALYVRWTKHEERWGEVPKRIEKIEIPISQWRDYFE